MYEKLQVKLVDLVLWERKESEVTPRFGEERKKHTLGDEENEFHFGYTEFELFMDHAGKDDRQVNVWKS